LILFRLKNFFSAFFFNKFIKINRKFHSFTNLVVIPLSLCAFSWPKLLRIVLIQILHELLHEHKLKIKSQHQLHAEPQAASRQNDNHRKINIVPHKLLQAAIVKAAIRIPSQVVVAIPEIKPVLLAHTAVELCLQRVQQSLFQSVDPHLSEKNNHRVLSAQEVLLLPFVSFFKLKIGLMQFKVNNPLEIEMQEQACKELNCKYQKKVQYDQHKCD